MIHADLWGNNLLFRAGQDGKPEHTILVDFQMTRCAPPAQDLFMLLHIVQDKDFRNAHEASLVDYYYDCLTEELRGEGLDISLLLPRSEFDESCVFYKKLVIIFENFPLKNCLKFKVRRSESNDLHTVERNTGRTLQQVFVHPWDVPESHVRRSQPNSNRELQGRQVMQRTSHWSHERNNRNVSFGLASLNLKTLCLFFRNNHKFYSCCLWCKELRPQAVSTPVTAIATPWASSSWLN